MKIFVNKIPLAFLFICLSLQAASAQGPLQSFDDIVQQAIQHNKTIQNGLLESQKTGLDRDMLKGRFLPHVSVNGLYGYVHSNMDIDVPTIQLPIPGANLFEGTQQVALSSRVGMAGVTASQVIFSGLQITNGQKALEQKQKAQLLLNEASYEQLATEIIQSFDQLMLLNEVGLLIHDSEKRLGKEQQKVSKAIENGLAIPYDRDKISLAMLELESKKAEVESNRDILYFKLEELTGIPTEELQQRQYKLGTLLLTDIDSNPTDRKEVQALEASQKAYAYLLKKEKTAILPQVFAVGNVSYLNAATANMSWKDVPVLGNVDLKSSIRSAPNYAVGIGLKWNILEGRSHKGNIDKAKLDLQLNANKLQDTKEKLALLQRKVKADYVLSLKKIAVSQQQVTVAKNNMYIATRQFEEGLVDMTERLSAENEYYKQSLACYNQILTQRTAAMQVLSAGGNLFNEINR